MLSTTEITSQEITSDNPIHQRLLFAYMEAKSMVQGDLLEIGCGVGRGLEILSQKVDHYTAIDKNIELINDLKKEFPSIEFIQQNIPPLALIKDNTFDFVVSFQVIEHIENDDLFIKEIYRVLKPGGKVIITTPNRSLTLTRNPWHVREYTADELSKLMGKYFSKITAKGVFGNEKIMNYYEKNKKSVEKFKKWDIFNLEQRLPRTWLQVPYEILNRLNRKTLMKDNNNLVNDISFEDYFLHENPTKSLDLFYIAEK